MINANDEEVMLEDNLEEDESGNDEGDSSEESEEQGHEEEGGDDDGETVTISKSEHEKLLRERFAAKRLREKKDDKGGKESTETEFDKEMIERTFIAVHGKIESPEIQDEAIRLARKFGMSVPDAMKDPDIKTRLDNLQKQAKARQAIAGQTGSGKNNNRGIDYHVEQYKTKGVLPSDPSTIAKILEKMAS